MTAQTLTVRLDSPHTITGSRQKVLAHLKTNGVALWLRANGRATFFYMVEGQTRQKTWPSFTIER